MTEYSVETSVLHNPLYAFVGWIDGNHEPRIYFTHSEVEAHQGLMRVAIESTAQTDEDATAERKKAEELLRVKWFSDKHWSLQH